MKKRRIAPPLFKVGDRVQSHEGGRTVRGVIAQDRGPHGAGGRRLYNIHVPADPHEPVTLVIPEEELEPDSSPPPKPLEKAEVLDYFNRGGFLNMLITGEQQPGWPPLVWLCRNSYGRLTHTYASERGQLGGVPVPRGVLHPLFLRPLPEKKDQLKTFLAGFGLTPAEAEEVIEAAVKFR